MEILLFCLGTIGMTHILVDGSIFQWLRDLCDNWLPSYLSKLIHCYQCAGFWCGLFCGWIAFPQANGWQIFLTGCASSVLSNFMAIFLNFLEAKTIISLRDHTGD
jgi:hypothetical protein